ncbi:MerR family transcriptional regulator [Maledivibacter halophilus]|uniref:DNA-binding transcriptional regulator, MerR family n=1 Tax=Maledivibacter halophilus TaxID=36842 RepID=A0A1T5LLW6_9FIRM|nr:MerR family transcriptional regulator [Maledivibacter halophilus]SKC76874.1 DNA-binding transcriptional regulator, MerR family [Maledivibacter halophilus]
MFGKYFKTGDVARFHNVSSDTVRYYDKEGLVTPTVVKNNKYRYYNINDTLKFSSATRLREVGVSINSIKSWLEYNNLNDLIAFNLEHIENLEMQRMLIDKKISYVKEFNNWMESFKKNPNAIEYKKDDFIYICNDLDLTVYNEDVNIDKPIDISGVLDEFWTRTSFLGYMNQLEGCDLDNKGKVYCANIVSSDCDVIERVDFTNTLRFNYIGDIFSDNTYLDEVIQKIYSYCAENEYRLKGNYYEVYYLSQDIDGIPVYYVHIYFPLENK